MNTKYWVIVKPDLCAYTTAKGKMIKLKTAEYGPFSAVSDAADYIAKRLIPLYPDAEIELKEVVTR